MIEIKQLHKKFKKVEVLRSLDLIIDQPGIFTVLGPNGSGKTTLIKSILGMVIPNRGSIEVFGKDIKESESYRENISYLPQIANFPSNLKVSELIDFIKDIRKSSGREENLIKTFKLEPFLNKKLGNLSGGTKQKVNIVLTFMFDSQLIILDEPTTGLDPVSLIELKKLIKAEREKGKMILITSHIISFVEEISDQIVFLLDGKIYFQGTVIGLREKTQQQNLEHAIAHILTQNHA